MGNEAPKSVSNFRYPSGNVYNGQMVGNKRHGQGTLQWPDGGHYSGQFANDNLEGYGKMTFPNHSSFEGNFVRNNPHGQGKLTTRNMEVLDGYFQFHGRSDQTSTPVGKYHFNGELIDLKTNWRQPLQGPLALYLLTGLVSLPNQPDPMEAMLPFAIATSSSGGEKGDFPVAAVTQSVPSTSASISYGNQEAAFRAKHKDDHGAVDVLDPRLYLNAVGVKATPLNTNQKKQMEIRTQQAIQEGSTAIPVAIAVPVMPSTKGPVTFS